MQRMASPLDALPWNFAQTLLGDGLQQEFGRRPGTVVGDQAGYQVLATALARRTASTLAWNTARALALAEAQEEGLVGLDHAGEHQGLDQLGQLKEAVAPAKRY